MGSTGLLIAVQKEKFNILNYKELHFNDCGDRVAQLLHVELAFPFSQWRNSDIRQEILIVNTHLLFPHDSSLSLVRLHQVSKHLDVVSKHLPTIRPGVSLRPTLKFFHSAGLQDTSICRILSERFPTHAHANHALRVNSKRTSIYFYCKTLESCFIYNFLLLSDWNGSKRGHVYKFLRSQGFVSSYDTAHHYTDADADKVKYLALPLKFWLDNLPITYIYLTSCQCSGLATGIIEEIYVL